MINKLKENDKLYILGDVIDKGPDGIKILQDVMRRQETWQVEFFMGNHEYMMLQTMLGSKAQNPNSKEKTYTDLANLPSNQQEKIREFLLDSLIYKQIKGSDQDYYLVHPRAIQDASEMSQNI